MSPGHSQQSLSMLHIQHAWGLYNPSAIVYPKLHAMWYLYWSFRNTLSLLNRRVEEPIEEWKLTYKASCKHRIKSMWHAGSLTQAPAYNNIAMYRKQAKLCIFVNSNWRSTSLAIDSPLPPDHVCIPIFFVFLFQLCWLKIRRVWSDQGVLEHSGEKSLAKVHTNSNFTSHSWQGFTSVN